MMFTGDFGDIIKGVVIICGVLLLLYGLGVFGGKGGRGGSSSTNSGSNNNSSSS